MTDAGIYKDQETSIINKIKTSPVKAEVFCLGIGSSCSMSFLEKFANVGNGISFHVSESNHINDRTQRLMQCATQSQFLRNLSFTTSDNVQLSTKKPLVSYFFGEPLNVFAKVEKESFKDEQIILKSGDNEFLTIVLDKTNKSPNDLEMIYHMTYLEQLLKFKDLYEMSNEEYNKTVIEIGCKYNIVTQFTSAIIVRELTDSTGNKTLEKVDIPIAVGKDKQQSHYRTQNNRSIMACSTPQYNSYDECIRYDTTSYSLNSKFEDDSDDFDMDEMCEDSGIDGVLY